MKLCISLATRNRPQQVVETITRSTANLVLPKTAFMVQVDNDDAPTIEALSKAELDRRVVVNAGEREDTIAAKWNRMLKEPADVYLIAADDDPYITRGYDEQILAASALFPDSIGMVYGRMANASFSSAVAPTAKFLEKIGGLPEYFPYWFFDHWTDDIARMIGRISFADIQTDQSKAGKTQEMREPGWWATWFDAAYLMRRKQARAIIDGDDFQEPEWRKEILRRHHPLIEYRSKWINDNVRVNAAALSAGSNLSLRDERYQRVRSRAVQMIPGLLEGMEPLEALEFSRILTPPTTVVGLKRAWA